MEMIATTMSTTIVGRHALLLLRRWEKTAAVKLCNHTCLDGQHGDGNDDDNDYDSGDDLHGLK